jgi:hypothetical protein
VIFLVFGRTVELSAHGGKVIQCTSTKLIYWAEILTLSKLWTLIFHLSRAHSMGEKKYFTDFA